MEGKKKMGMPQQEQITLPTPEPVFEPQPEIIKLFGAEVPVSALEHPGFWGFGIMLLAGIVLYAWIKYRKEK